MSTDTIAPPRRPSPRVVAERTERRRRNDMSPMSRAPLSVPGATLDPNYYYRWVDDHPGRIQALTSQDDYDPVTYADLGIAPTDADSNPGATVTRVADKPTGRKTMLLRKRKDWHDADKAKEQIQNDQTDNALRRGLVPASDGGQHGLSGEHAYIPEGGIRIDDGRRR